MKILNIQTSDAISFFTKTKHFNPIYLHTFNSGKRGRGKLNGDLVDRRLFQVIIVGLICIYFLAHIALLYLQEYPGSLCFICLLFIRYCLRAKHIFGELHEKPFVVELDLRGNYSLLLPTLAAISTLSIPSCFEEPLVAMSTYQKNCF